MVRTLSPHRRSEASRLGVRPGRPAEHVLHAIEHRDQWAATRPLFPWLLGLLTNRVHELRRRARRAVDPERLEAPRWQPGPREAAEQSELRDALRVAIDAVPEPHRTVLERHLIDGFAAHEVASELGVRAGTVRMRLHRGMEHLRRQLPQGVAPAALAFPTISPEFLASARDTVLSHAAKTVPATAPIAGAAALLAILAMKKSLLVATGLLVLALSSAEAD